jgi:hypothetical protein
MTSDQADIVKLAFTYGWPVVIGVSAYLWKQQNEKIESIKQEAKEEIMALNNEIVRQRQNIAKLFDQDREIEREMLRSLSNKADR